MISSRHAASAKKPAASTRRPRPAASPTATGQHAAHSPAAQRPAPRTTPALKTATRPSATRAPIARTTRAATTAARPATAHRPTAPKPATAPAAAPKIGTPKTAAHLAVAATHFSRGGEDPSDNPATPLFARPMVPPSPRDLDIYRLRYLEQYSIRLLADRFSLSPTRIRQLLYRVQVWLSRVLPPTDDPTQAQLAHLVQHLVAGQLQLQIDCLADQWEATHDMRCLRLQAQLLMMLAKLGVPPGTIEGLVAEASEAPALFGLTSDDPPASAPRSGEPAAGEPSTDQPLSGESSARQTVAGPAHAGSSPTPQPPTGQPCAGERPPDQPPMGEFPAGHYSAAQPPAGPHPMAHPLFVDPFDAHASGTLVPPSLAPDANASHSAPAAGPLWLSLDAPAPEAHPAGAPPCPPAAYPSQPAALDALGTTSVPSAPAPAPPAEPLVLARRKSPRKRTARGKLRRRRSRQPAQRSKLAATPCLSEPCASSLARMTASRPASWSPCAASSEAGPDALGGSGAAVAVVDPRG